MSAAVIHEIHPGYFIARRSWHDPHGVGSRGGTLSVSANDFGSKGLQDNRSELLFANFAFFAAKQIQILIRRLHRGATKISSRGK
jgi:hypothetical protein